MVYLHMYIYKCYHYFKPLNFGRNNFITVRWLYKFINTKNSDKIIQEAFMYPFVDSKEII